MQYIQFNNLGGNAGAITFEGCGAGDTIVDNGLKKWNYVISK